MAFLQPNTVINAFGILPGMHVADFGAGGGHWAIALAKLVGTRGTIYAIDVQPETLESVRSKAETAGIHHIETIRADVEKPRGSGLSDISVDFVLVANMLFQADIKSDIVKEIKRILKPHGRTAVIDWDVTDTGSTGPPTSYRISRKEVEYMFTQEGFQFEKEFSAGSHHYGLLFQMRTNVTN